MSSIQTKQEIIALLSASAPSDIEALRLRAYDVMRTHVGEKVFYRGIVELSNICTLDCLYCGIRKSNEATSRYTLTREEIVGAALWCARQGYGSVVLQSGERSDANFVSMIESVILEIKTKSRSDRLPEGLGITLSLGEQSLETLKKWNAAGAHRYLLRIETSNPALFEMIHPKEQRFDDRMAALRSLKQAGFQLGTGVMIGLPHQTLEMLADDVLFFKQMDVDMVGMGPFIPHHDTPFAKENLKGTLMPDNERFQLALNMIAATRIVCPDINIASTTALQAMVPNGRELGLLYGANVTMPNLTPAEVRKDYQLYDGKPCLEESKTECRTCLMRRVESTGRKVGFDEWGDSPHASRKSL
jgi:biotin synthase